MIRSLSKLHNLPTLDLIYQTFIINFSRGGADVDVKSPLGYGDSWVWGGTRCITPNNRDQMSYLKIKLRVTKSAHAIGKTIGPLYT